MQILQISMWILQFLWILQILKPQISDFETMDFRFQNLQKPQNLRCNPQKPQNPYRNLQNPRILQGLSKERPTNQVVTGTDDFQRWNYLSVTYPPAVTNKLNQFSKCTAPFHFYQLSLTLA